MPAHPSKLCGLILTLSLAASAQAAGDPQADQLVSLINQFRSTPQHCDGNELAPLKALAPDATLSDVQIRQGEQLQPALQKAGYQASNAQALAFSGPESAQAAMRMIGDRYCTALLNPNAADIGVQREGNTWQIILAQPLLGDTLGDWQEAGKAVLAQVNQARQSARRCGDADYEPAPALRWSDPLAAAALAHSEDMARQGYFSHADRDGRQVDARAAEQGYRFTHVGENIAAGQGAVEQVMAGWLASPEHCANIMEPAYTEMGAAYALNPEGEIPIVWTQVFGKPL